MLADVQLLESATYMCEARGGWTCQQCKGCVLLLSRFHHTLVMAAPVLIGCLPPSLQGSDFCNTAGYDQLVKRLKEGKRTCHDFEEFLEKR